MEVKTTCQRGDGNGSPEESVGKVNTMDDCVLKVKILHPNANGATFKDCGEGNDSTCSGFGNCFAEYNMNDSSGNEDFKSCFFGTGRIYG